MHRIATLVLIVSSFLFVACGGHHRSIVQDANGQKVVLNDTNYGLMSVDHTKASENSRRQAEIGKMSGDRQVELSEEAIMARERRGTWGGPMGGYGGTGTPNKGCRPKYYGQQLDPAKADRCQEADLVRDRRGTWGGVPYAPYGVYGGPFAPPGQSTYMAPSF